jgi:hypothetical protein
VGGERVHPWSHGWLPCRSFPSSANEENQRNWTHPKGNNSGAISGHALATTTSTVKAVLLSRTSLPDQRKLNEANDMLEDGSLRSGASASSKTEKKTMLSSVSFRWERWARTGKLLVNNNDN